MKLARLLQKGSLRGSATAIPATFATVDLETGPKVARVATVAVANAQKVAANDPAPTPIKAQADSASGAVIVGTIRPPGLSPTLLAASLALDAQIQAAGLLPGNAPDSDSYPTTAMTGSKPDLFAQRVTFMQGKGINAADAETYADKLVARDRENDDRRLCLECLHLHGYGPTSWRCGAWQQAGIATQARDAQLPADLVQQLQRCDGFADSIQPRTPT
jgi:hypothetical protein